MAPNLI